MQWVRLIHDEQGMNSEVFPSESQSFPIRITKKRAWPPPSPCPKCIIAGPPISIRTPASGETMTASEQLHNPLASLSSSLGNRIHLKNALQGCGQPGCSLVGHGFIRHQRDRVSARCLELTRTGQGK